jgi:hypothetical protein
MKPQGIILVAILVLVTVLVLVQANKPSQPEGMAILGALAPYQAHLNECIDQCNRSDPNSRLFSGSNTNCGVFCQSVFTQFARSGVSPDDIPLITNQSICEKGCEDHMKTLPEYIEDRLHPKLRQEMKRKCVNMCTGQRNAAEWCKKIQCPYSNQYFEDGHKGVPGCMKQCMANTTTNNNQNQWTWGLR